MRGVLLVQIDTTGDIRALRQCFLYRYGIQSFLLCFLSIALSVASAATTNHSLRFEPIAGLLHRPNDRALRRHIHLILPQYLTNSLGQVHRLDMDKVELPGEGAVCATSFPLLT